MALQHLDAAALHRAENIALLHQLCQVPAAPSSNPYGQPSVHESSYSLSMQQERQLTGVLAFLSSVTDNPDFIPAVAVDEGASKTETTVLVAINKGRENDGNSVLQEIGTGFETIFALLSQVETLEGKVLQDSIFSSIISMCQDRILSRLRLARKTKRFPPKRPFEAVLREIIAAVEKSQSITPGGFQRPAQEFQRHGKIVIKLVDAWSKHRVLPRLESLVAGIARLRKIESLNQLINSVPERLLHPDVRRSLLNMLAKTSRYHESSRYLHHMAKTCPVMKSLTVVLVRLPQTAFRKALAENYVANLEPTLRRHGLSRSETTNETLCPRLFNATQVVTESTFQQQARKSLREAKIHAEIQIIFYCANLGSPQPPRVVRSSKDACYLCNLFVKQQKQMYTPHSHGKLYPGWRLPQLPSCAEAQLAFDQNLKQIIRSTINARLTQTGKKIRMHPDPNESRISTLPDCSASSMASVPIAIPIQQEGSDPAPLAPLDAATPRLASLHEVTVAQPSATQSVESAIEMTTRTDAVTNTSSNISHNTSTSTSLATNDLDFHLTEGKMTKDKLRWDSRSRKYKADSLGVQVEYAARQDSSAVSAVRPPLFYRIEWLTSEDAARLKSLGEETVVDAGRLSTSDEYAVQKPQCFYVGSGESVVRISFRSNKSAGEAGVLSATDSA